jgi:hypothetical protein
VQIHAEDLRESHDWTPTKGKYTIVKTEEQDRAEQWLKQITC